MQPLSSTWGSWKPCCRARGARAMGQHRIWRDRTTLAIGLYRIELSQFALLLPKWQSPEPAHSQPEIYLDTEQTYERATSLSYQQGLEEISWNISSPPPSHSSNFPLGLDWEFELWQFWWVSWPSLCWPGNCQMLRCRSRIFFLEAPTSRLMWSKLYLSQDDLNRSKEDPPPEGTFFNLKKNKPPLPQFP